MSTNKVSALKAALREAMTWDWNHYEPPPEMRQLIGAALADAGEPWTAYKPGDKVPAGMSYWVMVRDDGGFGYSRRSPFIVSRDEDGKGGSLFYDWQWGGIDDIVTHYIPIATPEPPK